jgi:succinate-semialdehyde dehydrogenase/glutarate-semialdehyde dehydrogenase
MHLNKLAGLLEEEKEVLADLITSEMGKPIRESIAEIDKCAWVCRYYAEHAPDFLKKKYVDAGDGEHLIVYRPMGLILAIMPWNFPFWQVFRFAAPALMAGNGILLKHAPNVFGCAEAMQDLVKRAGFPPSIFTSLLINEDQVEEIMDHAAVRAATLTGSTRAGRAVAAMAGQRLKKTVLELGGSDPYIVLGDASMASAVDICAQSRMINGGQSCIAAKRFIVVEECYQEFVDQLKTTFEHIQMGDPTEETTDLGPLARADLRDALHDQVTRSIRSGARCEIGGEVPEGEGNFYPPTILTDVIPGMPAFDEELFGPVAAVIRATDVEEAILLANQSSYGLGAAVFTSNLELGQEIAEFRLEAGSCVVNDFVRSDPRLPFGGIKDSGYGRELGAHGILEFVNIKTIGIHS